MCRRLLIATFISLVCPTSLHAEDAPLSDDEVFAQVFSKRPVAAHLPLALEIDGKQVGSVVLLRAPTGDELDSVPVLAALADARLDAPILARLSTRSRISLTTLRSEGLVVVVDEQRLSLSIAIPGTLMRKTTHSLSSGVPEEAATAVRPSAVSGYVNTFVHAATDRASSLRADGVVNVNDWVLSARGHVSEQAIARRGEFLMTHDVPSEALRYLAGDFAVSGTVLQPGYPMLGIGVTRNFSLQPYRRIQPVGSYELVLDSPSRVTFLVDGAPVQTLELAAGRHDIRDFAIGGGIADVELVIQDASGHERHALSSINPGDLLAPGIVQFSVGAGFPLISDVGFREYAWERPLLTARRRWGVSNRMTLGVSADGDLGRQTLGGSVALGSPVGNLSLDTVVSHDAQALRGHATSARYDYARASRDASSTTLTIAARHFTPSYRSVAVLDETGKFSGDLTVLGGRSLSRRSFLRANVRYQVARGDAPDVVDAGLSLNYSLRNMSIDASVSVRDSGPGPNELRGMVRAYWRLPGRRGGVRASSRVAAGNVTNTVRYSTTGGGQPRNVVASVGVQQSSAASAADAAVAYTHERFVVAAGTATSLRDGATVTAPRGDVEVGTALAFAGGTLAWSRPISGSFAIVERNAAIADQLVGVNHGRSGYAARADDYGPGVVLGLQPYRVGSVRLESPDMPVGRSLGASRYNLLPTFNSGTLLSVGEPGTVFLRGTLQQTDGTPLAFAAGELVVGGTVETAFDCASESVFWTDRIDCLSELPPATAAAPRSWMVMTNGAGRFAVTGVAPGRYELRLPGVRPVAVTIPTGHAGVFTVGNVRTQRAAP